MKTFAIAAFVGLFLTGCAGNPADQAAKEASTAPVTAEIVNLYTSQARDITLLPSAPKVWTDQMPPTELRSVLVKAGYVQYVYDTAAQRFPELTAKGREQHWDCKTYNGTDGALGLQNCQVPIGTMQIGAATLTDSMGQKVVQFDCTAVPNDLGVDIKGPFQAKNYSHLDGGDGGSAMFSFGTKHVCAAAVGPDGHIMH